MTISDADRVLDKRNGALFMIVAATFFVITLLASDFRQCRRNDNYDNYDTKYILMLWVILAAYGLCRWLSLIRPLTTLEQRQYKDGASAPDE